jgi:hypothetical protein
MQQRSKVIGEKGLSELLSGMVLFQVGLSLPGAPHGTAVRPPGRLAGHDSGVPDAQVYRVSVPQGKRSSRLIERRRGGAGEDQVKRLQDEKKAGHISREPLLLDAAIHVGDDTNFISNSVSRASVRRRTPGRWGSLLNSGKAQEAQHELRSRL